ncbi:MULTISPECIES: MBL fold metallo-hydrolase [unclassified Aminobacter]|uniref:MBL fold metallo-hydrolase n=1 Tax=unclassified Aminobacter TaxID=2644704 RepID=UPI000463C86A|nr:MULTISPECIES: MBL fold metallo-hydrolase [unclassified Aminobacter]TWH34481.1 glyoxylase-like metal-dependent hydrolase (beta-lactamase superfamily II) [Aminobacter sp. J15]
MAKWQFTRGIHDLGNGCYAYLQPDGSWGWSNAGLIVDGDATLMVDTLFDLKLTAQMLAEYRTSIPAAKEIGILVNTHADGDHTFGNQLVEGARIIGTQGTVDDFARFDPKVLETICANAEQYGSSGSFIRECFRPFDFSGITLTPPTETFSGTMEIMVGDKKVQLIEVGPSHSLGDALIYVPDDKVLYTGDILFTGGTPIAWYGPVERWINVCDMVLDMDVETIVPGHGPLSTRDDVREMRDYLQYVTDKARPLWEAGMDYLEASYKVDLGQYRDREDAERVVVTIQTLFDDFDHAPERPVRPPIPYFAEMKSFRHHLGRGPVHEAYCKACGLQHGRR